MSPQSKDEEERPNQSAEAIHSSEELFAPEVFIDPFDTIEGRERLAPESTGSPLFDEMVRKRHISLP